MRCYKPSKQKLRREGHLLRQSLTFPRAAIAIALLTAAGCRAAEKQPEVPIVRLATIMGRIMNPLGTALSKVLPARFPARVEVQRINNSGEYPRMIETGQIEM